MDYNLSIPDIYNCNRTEILDKKFTIKILKLTLSPNIIYDFKYDYNTEYIYSFYFKTNTQKIIFSICNSPNFIHNNLLLFNLSNHRTDNVYDIRNLSDIEQYIEIYIIYKNSHSIELINCRTILYNRQYFNLPETYSAYRKYDAQYNDAMQTYEMMINFYLKIKNNNFDKMIRLESNNIIFYFKYNYKSKISNTQYLYKYNLVKIENMSDNINYTCELNNLQLNNISNVIEYLKNIEDIYENICNILNTPINKYEYYLLDFITFMIKNEIDELYFNKLTYDV